ncbi:MAG TPA: NADH-quinone oxidoreductase subunit J, partial [Pyrinomonadaceae bacterium]|nr:NADH-quinone oxidoreductase subunit J [Pyrinomonadaceae bacterium]
ARDAALPAAETRVSRISEDTETVGASLFRYAALPFEIASVLLLVAIVGSVLLARTARQERAADDLDPGVPPEPARVGPGRSADVDAFSARATGAAEEV